MIIKLSESIVLSRAHWDHIPCWRAYHRGYPDLRGEADSQASALEHLERWLTRARDAARDDRQRASLNDALQSVKKSRRGAKHDDRGSAQRNERVPIEDRLMSGVKMVHCR